MHILIHWYFDPLKLFKDFNIINVTLFFNTHLCSWNVLKIMKKLNEECNLQIGFDDTFKADNHILAIVSRANRKIGWMVRNLISREANGVFKIHITLIRPHIEYCTQVWASLSKHWNWSVILRLEGIQRRVKKLIKKKSKKLLLQGEIGRIRINCEAYSSFEGVSSNHWIVMAKTRLSLRKNATWKTTTIHYDWTLLNNRDIRDKYALAPRNKYDAL